MTTSQLILMTSLYLAAFVGVAYFTLAKAPRIAGSLGGGAVIGAVALLAIALAETQGWWRVPKAGSSHFQLLLWLNFERARLLDYLEGGPPLRRTRAGRVHPGSGSNRPAARLPCRRSVPGLDHLLAGHRAGPRHRDDLCLAGSYGARSDAHRRRPAQGDSFARRLSGEGKNSAAGHVWVHST